MKPVNSLIILIGMYLLAQSVSISVGLNFIPIVSTHPDIEKGEIPTAVPQPDAPETSIFILIWILFLTAILLILIKYKVGIVIRIFMFLGMFVGLYLSLWSFFKNYEFLVPLGDYSFIIDLGFILALIFYVIFLIKKDNQMLMNGVLILTTSGIGGYLGASLGIVPALLLLLLLTAYDIIAVFGTKHMVTLAKGAKDKIPMFSVPMKERSLGIGTGDIAIPAVFTVSVLKEYPLNFPIVAITVLGGLLGLISLFFYILNREKVVLPALPPITIGLVIGFLIGLILF